MKYRLTMVILLLGLAVGRLAQPVLAQEPQPSGPLRLLAWALDGTFLIATTPGEIVNRADGSRQQLSELWLLSADGQPVRHLADGLEFSVGADLQAVTFVRFDAGAQVGLWQISLADGSLSFSPAAVNPASGPSLAVGRPGQTFRSPDGQKQIILVNQSFKAELWLVVGAAQPRQILVAEGELFSDVAWRSDGEAIAFIRTALGSSTEASSELWRLDLTDNRAQPLSRNNVVDRTPLWSRDGLRLAVVRNEQVIVVPADRLQVETFEVGEFVPLTSTAPQTQQTPPAVIRVIHHSSNTCRNVTVGQIDLIPFEQYVRQVVPNEVFPSWPAETLKAQAVAARTYGWYFINQDPAAAWHVTDWVNFQYMCDSTVPSTDAAVNATAGVYLAYQDEPILAFFSAENASPTRSNNVLPYIQAVDDPVSFGQTRNGHGWGMGQWGAQRWADQHDWTYQAILRHYYSGVTVEAGAAGMDTALPNVALIRPWSDYDLTTDHLWLLANTSDDGQTITRTNIYLSTSLTTTQFISTIGPTQPDGYLLDISTWPDQSLTSTLVFTVEAFDQTGKQGISPPIFVGLDRTAPSGYLTTTNTLTPSSVISETSPLTLTLTISDTTSDAAMALGDVDWLIEGEDFAHSSLGSVISDASALNGRTLSATVSGGSSGIWSISNPLQLSPGRAYRAYFRLKINDTAVISQVTRLEVIADGTDLIGLSRLRGIDFRAAAAYQEFQVDFDYESAASLEFRVAFLDVVDLAFDRLVVLDYPVAYTREIDPPYNNLRLKVIDGAGNVSEDLAAYFQSETWEIYLPVIIR